MLYLIFGFIFDRKLTYQSFDLIIMIHGIHDLKHESAKSKTTAKI